MLRIALLLFIVGCLTIKKTYVCSDDFYGLVFNIESISENPSYTMVTLWNNRKTTVLKPNKNAYLC